MRTYVAGHRGMVGSAILRQLEARGAEAIVRSRAELELLDRSAVRSNSWKLKSRMPLSLRPPRLVASTPT